MAVKKLSPEVIRQWNDKNPGSLEKLIAEFGFMCYKQAIADLMIVSKDVRQIESNTAVLIAPLIDYDKWAVADRCIYRGDAMRSPEADEFVVREVQYESNCCGAPLVSNTSDVCGKCKEHCGPIVS